MANKTTFLILGFCYLVLFVINTCHAQNEPGRLLDQILGSDRAAQNKNTLPSYKLSNDDVALIQNIQTFLNDSKKMSDLINIFGDKKCFESLMKDKDKLSALINTFSKYSNPSVMLNDQSKMSEIMKLFNGNDCLQSIFKDKQKLQMLTGILGDLKSLQSLQTLMASKDRIPKLIEYLQVNPAVSEKLLNTQLQQLVSLFGDSKCLQTIMSDKTKISNLMKLVGNNANPATLLNDKKKLDEIKNIFSGNDCILAILNDKDKLQKLTALLNDVQGLQSLQKLMGAKNSRLNGENRAITDEESELSFNFPYIFQRLLDNKATPDNVFGFSPMDKNRPNQLPTGVYYPKFNEFGSQYVPTEQPYGSIKTPKDDKWPKY